MADGPQIGRVVVDVDINSAEVRGEIRAALADRFQISVDVTKRSLTESRAKIRETISAKPYRISVDVSQANLARVRGEIRAALAAPFAINVVAATRGAATAKAAATKVAKSITDAERREEAVRKTIAARGEQDRVRIAERGRQQRATIRMRERAAEIKAERAHQRSLIRDRLLADQRIALHDRRALDSRLAAQQRHQDQLSRSQESFRQKQLLAQQKLNNQLIAQAARTQAKIAAINRRPIGLQALQGIQALSAGLAQFDAMAVRILASSLRAFTAWSVGVSAVFAGVSALAIKTFSVVELAGRRAGAIFASKDLLEGLRRGERAFGDYAEDALRSSEAVIEASNKVAVATIFNPREIAESARALAQAGLSEADALQAIGVNARFAQATQTDLLESTKLLTSGVHAAGLEMSQMSDLADKLAVASFEAQSDVDQIGEAFARTAGQFTGLGQTVDETVASIALMARTGVEGRGAADQLNQGIRFLTAAAAKAPDKWREFGLSINDADGNMRPFLDIMMDVREVFVRVQEQTGDSALAFRVLAQELRLPVRSMRPLFQMMQQLGDDESINALRENVRNATGAIEAMSEVIESSLSVVLQNTIERFHVAFQEIGKAASGGVHETLSAFQQLEDQMNEGARRIGVALGDTIGRMAEFLLSPEFSRGISIFQEAVRVTLEGFRGMFREFGLAAGDGESAFVGFAEAVLAFSRATARVLPAAARIIGRIIRLLRENADTLELVAKASLGLIVVRRLIGLTITPAVSATRAIIGMRRAITALVAVEATGGAAAAFRGIATALGLVDRRALAAKRSMDAMAASAAASNAVLMGATASSASALAAPAAVARVTRFQRAIALVTGSFARMMSAAGLVVRVLGRLSIVAGVVITSFDFLRGFVNGLRDSFRMSGGESKRFSESVATLKPIFDFLAASIRLASRLVRGFGEFVGRAFGRAIVESINAFAWAVRRLADAYRELDRWVRRATRGQKEFVDAFIEGHPQLGGVALAIRGIRKIRREMERTASVRAKPGLGGLFDSIQGAISKTTELSGRLRGVMGRIGTDLRRRFDVRGKPGALKLDFLDDDDDLLSDDLLSGFGPTAAARMLEFRDRTQEARVVVAGMSIAERRRAVADIIRKIDRAGAASYSATRHEMALLERAMPGIERAIESQRKRVQDLTNSLDSLRNAQLRGTKAFSDAAFRHEQAIKRLQLQRIDLIRAGTPEDDERIAEIDEEIRQIELKAERSRLIESLRLDPLRRKLDETFSPVREVTFREAMDGFRKLSRDLDRETEILRRQELTLESLTGVVERASERFEDMDTVARANIDSINAARQAAEQASGAYESLGMSIRKAGSSADIASGKTKTLGARQDTAARQSKVLAQNIDEVSNSADDAAGSVKELADNAIWLLVLRLRRLLGPNTRDSKQITDSGTETMRMLGRGIQLGVMGVVLPGIGLAHTQVASALNAIGSDESQAKVSARRSGESVMQSFWSGMQERFGDKSKKAGTIAHWLGVQIPDMIRELKGPVSYDAQILVPAGEAVMHGFEQGLRRGFEPVRGFLRDVGPSMEEHVPTDLFIKRSANFMVDVARGEMPDPYEVFADLVPTPLGEFAGILDPTLAFLHKTRSLADTEEMAAHLAKLFNLVVTDTIRPPGTLTSSGRVSDHSEGTAADFGGAVSNMDRLVAAIKPLFGQIFKQIIWRNKDVNRGFFVPDHMDHVHAAWLKAADFSLHSGKKGPTASLPGVPALIAQALSSASQRTGVSLQLLAAIARAESSFNPRAVSPAGAQGLMQLMPGTAAGLGVTNPFDPFQNALGGAKYIKQQLDRFGSIELALAAYNAGPGNALRALTSFRETIAYVRRVKDFLRIFAGFREHGGPTIAGRAYVVGEAGPEIHIPRTSGTVIDAETTRALLSGRSRGDITYSPTYNLKTATRDPRATAEMIDSHTMGRLRTVVL